MVAYEQVKRTLSAEPSRWCVTGAAGFIGSHLVQALLCLDQEVIGVDDFSTGRRENIEDVLTTVGSARAARFRLVEGDIRDLSACRAAMLGVQRVLHQAALGSVPRSIKDPRTSHDVNVTGFMNVLLAARDAGVKRIVYASSSSVYGDHPDLPKREDVIGRPLSPYAVTKLTNELYAEAFAKAYGLELMGLRYFNVFGPRQDPDGPYAAVMPRWFAALLGGGDVVINGDGETSRDFCYVANVVQANLLAASSTNAAALGRVYNVACGERTTLNELFAAIRDQVARFRTDASLRMPSYAPFRPGDIRHSLAAIDCARSLLGYAPSHGVRDGLVEAAAWYASHASG
ncbi:NAD-dependent epimerase [Anaeromyxobacter oryzae]|uniref:NAD-dependent epimerase n=2 Tax=Anaeromyxobacter oryzae TaxID=2918170 RepID=A0ABN6MVA4_9BACT|nr:NAD-dependent epimerase [Anaeromyxobacter oryzae]